MNDKLLQKSLDEKPKLGFIGAGILGTALAIRLSERGYKVISVSSRSQTSASNQRAMTI